MYWVWTILVQFISYQRLVITLDSSRSFTYLEILVPNILSWVMLFVSSLIMFTGLREREIMRIRWLVRTLLVRKM